MAAETMLFSKSRKKAKIGFAVQQRSTSLLNVISYSIFSACVRRHKLQDKPQNKKLQRAAQPQTLELMNEF